MAGKKVTVDEISQSVTSSLEDVMKKTLPKKASRAKMSEATSTPGKKQEDNNTDEMSVSDEIAVVLGTAINALFFGKNKQVNSMNQLTSMATTWAKGTGDNKKGIFGNLNSQLEDIRKGLLKQGKPKIDDIQAQMKSISEKLVSRLDTIISSIAIADKDVKGAGGETEVDVNINANSDASKFLEAISNQELEEKTRATLTGMAELTDEKGPLNEYIDNLEKLDKKTQNIGDFENLKQSQEKLKTAVGSMDKKTTKQIEVSMQGWVEMAKAVAIASATLLLAGYAMKYVKPADVLKFTGLLSIFMLSVAGTAILVGKYAKDAAPSLKAALGLVAGAALIMFLGQMVAEYIDFGNLMYFTTCLGIFLFVIVGILSMVLDMLTQSSKKIKSQKRILGIPIKTEYENGGSNPAMPLIGPALGLVAGAALIMLIGSLIIPIINIKNLFMFTIMLGLFLFTIFGIVALISKMMNFGNTTINVAGGAKKAVTNNIKGSNPLTDALKLVIGATFIMFLGSFAVDAIKPGKLIKFTVYLAGFLMAIGLALVVGETGWEAAGKGAMKMVAMATLIMFIGALAVDHIPFGNLLKFTVSLSLFLLGIGLALRAGGDHWEKMNKRSLLIAATVGILAAVMIVAGKLYLDNPGLDAAVAIFCLTAVLFIGALAGIAALIGKFDKYIAIGVPLMMKIAAIANLIGLSVIEIAAAVAIVGGNMGRLWSAFGIMMAIVGGLTLLCGIIGIPVVAAAVEIGVGVMASIAAVAMMLATTMLILAGAIFVMSKIKAFDPKPIINAVEAISNVMASLIPIGLMSWAIIPAELAMVGLAVVLSLIANTVKDYAELKVPIYAGTKVIGYRQLNQRDFTEAAKNVGIVVTVLSEAVIKATEKHPDYFEWGPFSKLAMACRALERLGPLISKIAIAVKDYAQLRVPEEWNAEGKATKYRHLNENDFKSAAENVKKVVSVLGGAIIAVYNANPEIYTAGGFGDFLGMDTPFVRVIKNNMQLANLISKIAKAVYDVACGKVPTKWNEKGEGVEFEHLNKQHFKDAAKNVKLILTTLGGVITEIASDPNMEDLYGGEWGNFFGVDSKFTRVIKANMKLGDMISKISKSVLNFANGRVTTKWNEKGEGIEFEHLGKKHFKEAAKNVKQIITLLGNVIIDLANDEKTKDLYGSDWDNFWGIDNMFTRVVKANIKLGEMISKIGGSVEKFANMKIAVYEKNSDKIKTYIQMKPTDFKNAAKSVDAVLSLLGETLIAQYNKNKKWYDEDEDDNPLYKVINVCIKMSKIISEIAKAMKDYAELRIPDKWDEDGKVTAWRQMNNTDFENAGTNILTIVSLLGETLLTLYNKKKEWFDEEDKDKNPLYRVLDCSMNLAKLVGEMGRGIKEMAQSKFVDVNGKIQTVEESDIEKAGENIGTIVCTLAEKLIKLGSDPETAKYFEPVKLETKVKGLGIGFSHVEEGNSVVKNVINSVLDMGQLISGIAQGVQQLADMVVTDATGKPRKLTDQDFKRAADNVAKIVTAIGSALMSAYGEHIDWFKKPLHIEKGTTILGGLIFDSGDKQVEGETTPFQEMMTANIQLGELISSVAQGVVLFAKGFVPGPDGKPIQLNDTVYTQAGSAIGKVMEATGTALVNVAKNSDYANIESPKLEAAVKAITSVSSVVTNIAEAVRTIAEGEVPVEYDPKTGKVIKSEPIGDAQIKAAGEAIDKIITAIGTSIANVVSKHSSLFEVAKITQKSTTKGSALLGLVATGEHTSYHTELGGADTAPIVIAAKAIGMMSSMVGAIADAVVMMGSANVPEIGADGKPTGKYTHINIDSAAEKLEQTFDKIINAVVDSISGTVSKHPEMFQIAKLTTTGNGEGGMGLGILASFTSSGTSESMADASTTPFMVAAKSIAMVLGLVGEVVDAVEQMACMRMPVYVNGQLDHYEKLPENALTTAQTNITSMITGIYKGVVDAITTKDDGTGKTIEEITKEALTDNQLKQMGKVFEVVSTAVDTMSDFFEAMREVKFNDPEEFKTLLSKLMTMMENAQLLAYLMCHEDPNEVNAVLSKTYPDLQWKFANSFGYIFGHEFANMSDTKDIERKLPTITSVVECVIDEITAIYEKYKENKTIINAFIDPNENITQKIATALSSLMPLISLFLSNKQEQTLMFGSMYMYNQQQQENTELTFIDALEQMQNVDVTDKIHGLFSMTEAILDGIILTGEKMNIASQYDYSHMASLVSDFKDSLIVMASLNGGATNENDLIGNVQQLPTTDEMTTILINTTLFYEAIDNIVNAAIKAQSITEDSFDILCYGISMINETIKKLNNQNVKVFQQQTNILDKFVKVVNTVKISNIDKLTQFVMSMNLLAAQLGNIDNLTKVLAEKLSKALEDLTKRLEHAERTIQDADALQRRRHELIKQSVNEVKQIMAQSISVEVSQSGGGMTPASPASPATPPIQQSGSPSSGASGGNTSGSPGTSSNTSLGDGGGTGNKNSSSGQTELFDLTKVFKKNTINSAFMGFQIPLNK